MNGPSLDDVMIVVAKCIMVTIRASRWRMLNKNYGFNKNYKLLFKNVSVLMSIIKRIVKIAEHYRLQCEKQCTSSTC